VETKLKLRKFLLVAILAMATTSVLAQQSQENCDVGARMREAATQAADRERQMLEQIASREKQLALQASTSCIDKYKNLNLSGMLGLGSFDLGGVFDGLISGAANAVCRAVDNQVAQATQPFNQSMVLPGGVGRVDTRLFGASGGAATANVGVPGLTSQVPVATATATPAGANQQGLIDRASNALSNLFK
jgi:hypothetical protein